MVGRGYRLRRCRRRETALSATSVDGLHFTLDVPVERLALGVGGYVVVGDGGSERLAYTTEVALDPSDRRLARVEGRMLDGRGGPSATPPPVRPARTTSPMAEAARPARAALEVGSLTYADGVPLALDAGAFDRHTFLCGQSGSGKTYALGTILERLLAETTLRVVVLDRTRTSCGCTSCVTTPATTSAPGTAPPEPIDVRRAGADRSAACTSASATSTRWSGRRCCDSTPSTTERSTGAARGRRALDDQGAATVAATIEALLKADGPFRSLGLRARNLGVDRWQIWSGADTGSLEELVQPGGPRCVVADLGSLETRDEQAVAAEALLAALWRRRAAREPVLIVIDEAHNVCPARPEDPLTAIATEHAVRIAGEGRKFGLVLLVATQRPQKVHENVVSQCDNLVLMRMNSRSDLAGSPRRSPSCRRRCSHSRRSSARARRSWRASSSRARRSAASGRAGRSRAAPTCRPTGPRRASRSARIASAAARTPATNDDATARS